MFYFESGSTIFPRLLELHALTLAARSYALLFRYMNIHMNTHAMYTCAHVHMTLSLSPATDSGKGASSEAGSRPNSQVINYSIDESNVRTVRSETDMRKKSNQSVHSDQGVVTDETTSPKTLPRSQTVVEGRERIVISRLSQLSLTKLSSK